jgi:predicted nuclease of predicted toxin-antitoxin system
VKFLLDENQSPLVAASLGAAGHDAVHVRTVGLAGASDVDLLEYAVVHGRVIISGDTDFGELLARSNASTPSLILLRRQQDRRAAEIAALVLANLDVVVEDLETGAIVVFDEDRLRIRRLPLRPD